MNTTESPSAELRLQFSIICGENTTGVCQPLIVFGKNDHSEVAHKL